MKKKLYKGIYGYLLFSMMTAFLLLSSCKDDVDNMSAPVVTEIRNYAASPNDTAIQTLQAGQWIVLMGQNFDGLAAVLFGTTQATLNYALMTDHSIVIQVPFIPFQSAPRDKVNEIILIKKDGTTTTFDINITGAPLISHVRNYADAPNDTLLNAIAIGQQINLIGYNLKGATAIAFQGLEIDLAGVIYTDTSVIVNVPGDFTDADASLANKITYTTAIGTSTFSIPIFDPVLLEYYKDPLYTLLAGGLDQEKTWVIDFNAEGVSQKFAGPIWFSGDELRWDYACATDGGNCWYWAPEWQGWMPPPKDYGTMTFKLKGAPIIPSVVVIQKGLDAAKNGTFSGGFFLDVDAKTITFSDVIPLNMGWENAVWDKAYIISLTADGMQLGFKHKSKNELELYNFIPK
jgi:hypothetical protein